MLERRTERLAGDVSLAVPMSWQLIGYALLAALAAALFFLFTASYARVENVAGAIVLDRGVAPVVPSRAGIVAALAVREGQRVRAGDPLARIRSGEDLAGGGTAPERMRSALAEQDERLASQGGLVRRAAAAEQARLAAESAGLGGEIASLDTQLAAQRRLVEVARGEFDAVQGVAGRGFISRRDLESREAALLSRRQRLAELEQLRVAKAADLAATRRAAAKAGAAAEAEAAGLQSSRAALAGRMAEVEAAGGYTLVAPVDGVVTALTARPGQPADRERPLMIVLPAGAAPRAELYVPSAAAGFLAIGQQVRLAVDAFPYQRFGAVDARIVQISSVAIPRATADGSTAPVYLVTAELARPSVTAFGREQPLLPGMALTARIVTERQSLAEWLFEPLVAVRRR